MPVADPVPLSASGVSAAMKFNVSTGGLALLVIISVIFTVATYRINSSSIAQVRGVQQVVASNSKAIEKNCRYDVKAIAAAHEAVKRGFKLEAAIAENNVDAIDYGVRNHLIPANLMAYYAVARQRQVDNQAKFIELSKTIESLAPIC